MKIDKEYLLYGLIIYVVLAIFHFVFVYLFIPAFFSIERDMVLIVKSARFVSITALVHTILTLMLADVLYENQKRYPVA